MKICSLLANFLFLVDVWSITCCSPCQIPSDGDAAEVDIPVIENSDALRLQEEEIRRKIELEADERKLEETLEYQRRIENEAKQKHLAELQKKSAQTNLEDKAALAVHDNLIGPAPSVEGVGEHFKPSVMVNVLFFVILLLFGYLNELWNFIVLHVSNVQS